MLRAPYAIATVKNGVIKVCLGALCILSMLTPFGHSLDSTLTLHMTIQHFFYIAGGFLLASGVDLLVLGGSKFSKRLTRVYSELMKVNASFNKRGLVAFAVAALFTAYWHIPANLDAAVIDNDIHIIMHVTFTFVGALLFIGAGMLTGRMRHVLLLVPGKAMGLFGAFLLFTPMYVYQVYPASQQTETGVVMVVMMLVMDLTIVPYWLYNYFGKVPIGMSQKINKP